jgi:hypothetical protein
MELKSSYREYSRELPEGQEVLHVGTGIFSGAVLTQSKKLERTPLPTHGKDEFFDQAYLVADRSYSLRLLKN